jgi:hypothetical protein
MIGKTIWTVYVLRPNMGRMCIFFPYPPWRNCLNIAISIGNSGETASTSPAALETALTTGEVRLQGTVTRSPAVVDLRAGLECVPVWSCADHWTLREVSSWQLTSHST